MNRLAKLLNDAIDARAKTPEARSAIISRMARAAGIEPGTVQQILRGEIETPPDERLRGFARVLDLSFDSLAGAVGSANAAMVPVRMAALALPDSEAGAEPPEWIDLLPAADAQGLIHTYDGRGPFRVDDMDALIAASMTGVGTDRPVIDENHNADKPDAPNARATGWIEAMEVRDGRLMARVSWTKFGRDLIAERLYRAVSPVFMRQGNRIVRILRAALVNTPNLRGLATLSSETGMDLETELARLLGLPAGTPAAELMSAATLRMADGGNDGDAEREAMQAQIDDLQQARARDRAVTVIGAAIAEGRVGLAPARRDSWIERHMREPEEVEADIAAMPRMTGEMHQIAASPDGGGDKVLSAAERDAARALGITDEAFIAERGRMQKEAR